MHAASGSVSTTSNGSNSAPTALPKHRRYSSRSNSLSSASVVTMKRNGSLSSNSTGARNSTVPMGPQSPAETSLLALRLTKDPASQQDHRRRKSIAIDPFEHVLSPSEGRDNLDRWSQSTSSSATSLHGTRKHRASSGAVVLSHGSQQLSPQKRIRTALDQSPRSSPHRKPSSRPTSRRKQYSPEPSPEKLRPRPSRPDLQTSLTALPPLHTTPALTDPNDIESPSTTQTIQTPSTQSVYGQDYFGNGTTSPRSLAKSKRPIVIRNHTAPVSQVNYSHALGPEGVDQQLPWDRSSDRMDSGSRPAATTKERSGRRRSRTRERTEKEKKAMLSKALHKANSAVLLDNAQNFEDALEAYSEACGLLQQVMDRSTGVEDKRKLEAIRITYTTRIDELRQLNPSRPPTSDDNSLPIGPMSDNGVHYSPATTTVSPIDAKLRESIATSPVDDSNRDSAIFETATIQRIVDVPRLSQITREPDSFFSNTMEAVDSTTRRGTSTRQEPSLSIQDMPRRPGPVLPWRSTPEMQHVREEPVQEELKTAVKSRMLELPSDNSSTCTPAPLSPRKPLPPQLKPEAEESRPEKTFQLETQREKEEAVHASRSRANSTNSTSWLDTIDESSSSSSSSVHSLSLQTGARKRKHIRSTSGDTNPDFDAAFDAAVEAAYDEGFEPDLAAHKKGETAYGHAAKESIFVPSSEITEGHSPTHVFHPGSQMVTELNDDEEERLLDEIAQDYAHGFNFDLSSKSALPRQSGSSGYSRSTWQSSQTSVDRATAGTSLSTVAEDTLPPHWTEKTFGTPWISTLRPDLPPLSAPPPNGALPRPPSTGGTRVSSVRSRRMSGQTNAKQLKIETNAKGEVRKRAQTFHHSPSPRHGEDEQETAFGRDFKFGATLELPLSGAQHEHTLKYQPSLDMRSTASDTSGPLTATTMTERRRSSIDESPSELRTTRPAMSRKNKSSVSLRENSFLLSSPEESTQSIVTPMSSTFMSFASRRTQDPPTSQRANIPPFGSGGVDAQHASGGAYLFDTTLSVHKVPSSPRSPSSSTERADLEPCPEPFLLRPFWLMRAIASTLTHPRGGFLTNRLFVPREVWQTRGVKLKSVEDKVANCDLLTAALGRLAGVDTYDADAVMDELQSFEEVMERVQSSLAKKLGSEVGVGGASGIFKDAPTGGTIATTNTQGTDTVAGAERTSKSKEGKGYLNSWRKLRSKSSGAPVSITQTKKPAGEKESATMSSVPMTTFVPVERRGQKKNARDLGFEGPNKDYMGSLARLFEGVQVLDQIARQVEDPGLKHSSPTHVGLELSIRHAAEFFGFYICRFVLADLGTLLEKFVKRGTEWVLA